MNQGSNTVTWILAGALVLALMVIAFLVGRSVTPDATRVAVGQAAPPPSAPPIPAPPPAAEVVAMPETGAAVPPPPPAAEAPRGMRIEKSGGNIEITNIEPDQKDAEAVRAYFARIDAIQAGPAGMSPDAYAQQLMADASSGRTDGIDKLGNELAKAEASLKSVTPPEPCAQYHRELVEVAGGARELMAQVQRAFGGGGVSGLESLGGKAQALQIKQQRIDKMRSEIKRKYGLN